MRDDEAEFFALLAVFASNSRIQTNQTMLRVYDQAVRPYGYVKALFALEKIMMENKTWQMPTPRQIIDAIEQKPSKNSEAIEVVGRIFQAIERVGYANSERAREYIGELGWQVVKRFGGWSYITSQMGVELDPSTSRAQMREAALSIMEISEHRSIDVPPALPEPKNEKLQAAIKLISNAKEMPK